jgi:hypothetical protein
LNAYVPFAEGCRRSNGSDFHRNAHDTLQQLPVSMVAPTPRLGVNTMQMPHCLRRLSLNDQKKLLKIYSDSFFIFFYILLF